MILPKWLTGSWVKKPETFERLSLIARNMIPEQALKKPPKRVAQPQLREDRVKRDDQHDHRYHVDQKDRAGEELLPRKPQPRDGIGAWDCEKECQKDRRDRHHGRVQKVRREVILCEKFNIAAKKRVKPLTKVDGEIEWV